MYQHEVDVDMLNAVKSLLADVSSISPSSEQGVLGEAEEGGPREKGLLWLMVCVPKRTLERRG